MHGLGGYFRAEIQHVACQPGYFPNGGKTGINFFKFACSVTIYLVGEELVYFVFFLLFSF